MGTQPGLMLVIGATGQLGGAIARQLLSVGHRVRALGRNPEKLAALQLLGAETACGDLLDAPFVDTACAGVEQVVTTANNAMGAGASSPNRVDLQAYRNICRAIKAQHVSRIVHVSAQNSGGASSPVDFFRVKHQVDAVIRDSGVPWVLLAPTVFMEIWVDTLIGGAIRQGKPVMLFGDGTARANFIATDDVAQFAVRILEDRALQNTVIEVGGPSTCSFAEVTTMIERRLGIAAKRRYLPVTALRIGSIVLKPFSEMGARLMAMGYFTAQQTHAFTNWQPAARTFGVNPVTIEQFIEQRFVPPA